MAVASEVLTVFHRDNDLAVNVYSKSSDHLILKHMILYLMRFYIGSLSLCHGISATFARIPRSLYNPNWLQIVPVMPNALVLRAGVDFEDSKIY